MLTDLYALQQSEEFKLQNNIALRLDMELIKSPASPGCKLFGNVTYRDRPVCHATVVIVDPQLNPLTYTRTDQDGNYSITGLTTQSYGLTSSATGFLPSDTRFITFKETETKRADFQLRKSSRAVFDWMPCQKRSCFNPRNRCSL